MTLEHDLLQLARDAMRSLMNGREFGTGQTGYYLNIIRRIEDELNRPKPEQEPQMIQIKDGQLSYIKKPWVGLTNEELVEIRETHQAHIFQLMFAVEAKIREKNNAV